MDIRIALLLNGAFSAPVACEGPRGETPPAAGDAGPALAAISQSRGPASESTTGRSIAAPGFLVTDTGMSRQRFGKAAELGRQAGMRWVSCTLARGCGLAYSSRVFPAPARIATAS